MREAGRRSGRPRVSGSVGTRISVLDAFEVTVGCSGDFKSVGLVLLQQRNIGRVFGFVVEDNGISVGIVRFRFEPGENAQRPAAVRGTRIVNPNRKAAGSMAILPGGERILPT
jgi:hypothetical protein